jgi:CRP/FNR family transcriptional regulator, cyclic AMP receptor protein
MDIAPKLPDIFISIPWFSELNQPQRNRIGEISILRDVGAMETLFLEGDKEDYTYILLKGQVAIEMTIPGHEPVRVHLSEPGEIIGWSSVMPIIRQRTATARSNTPCQLLAIESVKFRELCDEDHDMGYFLMRRLANIVATRLLLTRLRLVDLLTNSPREDRYIVNQ